MSIKAGYLTPHPPLIIPQVGGGMEREIENTIKAYKKVAKKVKDYSPDTLILISPHAPAYLDYFQIASGSEMSGTFEDFGAEDVKIQIDLDQDLSDLIIKEGRKNELSLGYKGNREVLDHGSMVPLYFIQKEYSCPIVRLSVSGYSLEEHYKYGMAIQRAIEKSNKDIVVIISGDLSHYLDKEKDNYSEIGEEFDSLVERSFETGDFLDLLLLEEDYINQAGECGLSPLVVFMGIADGYQVSGDWMSYEAPFGVGYGVGEFVLLDKNRDRKYFEKMAKIKKKKLREIRESESEIVRLARHSLESMVNLGEVEDPKWELSSYLLEEKAGVFVTLNKNGKLRGCIGTIESTQKNMAVEIMKNAVSSGLKDFRFNPVKDEELDELIYSVDILAQSERIDSFSQLDIKKYGVIVESGNRRGLLLPNIESVKTVEEQVNIALDKAGIGTNEDYILKRFEVTRYF